MWCKALCSWWRQISAMWCIAFNIGLYSLICWAQYPERKCLRLLGLNTQKGSAEPPILLEIKVLTSNALSRIEIQSKHFFDIKFDLHL